MPATIVKPSVNLNRTASCVQTSSNFYVSRLSRVVVRLVVFDILSGPDLYVMHGWFVVKFQTWRAPMCEIRYG